jgi:hypothetical protein
MADRDVLAEAMEALEEAATAERSMRIGHDVARVLHAALTDVVTAHRHVWQPLGWDRGRNGTGDVHVAQACSCGAVRESTTSGVTAVSGGAA